MVLLRLVTACKAQSRESQQAWGRIQRNRLEEVIAMQWKTRNCPTQGWRWALGLLLITLVVSTTLWWVRVQAADDKGGSGMDIFVSIPTAMTSCGQTSWGFTK